MEIKPTDSVLDPACGTAGFLVETMHYLLRANSSPELVEEKEYNILKNEVIENENPTT